MFIFYRKKPQITTSVIHINTRNQDKAMVKLRIYRSQFAINEGKHRHVWEDTDFYQAQPREQLNLTGKYEIGSVANIYATTGY